MAVLHIISVISLSLAFVSALCILGYVIRHPQSMKIMNVVWPLTGLWAGLCGLWAFFSFGRPKQMAMKMDDSGDDMAGMGHDMKHNMNDMSMGSDLRFLAENSLIDSSLWGRVYTCRSDRGVCRAAVPAGYRVGGYWLAMDS